jgi:glucose/arabinose dehydrogenase
MVQMAFLLVIAIGARAMAAAPPIELEAVVTGIDNPVAITHAGDGSGRLFVTLQAGRIVIVDSQGLLLGTPFLDISDRVTSGEERGLLGTAFHPDYPANGFFYVNYTDLNGDTVIARYRVSLDPNVADPVSATVLLTVAQPFANHNGGQLAFGPDGYFYIGLGDGGSGGDPANRAQDLSSLLGKMLRIDVDGGFPYAVPPDNPFVATPGARPEIWALGLRNPWRFSFDRLTGALFIADVGQDAWEEVNRQSAVSTGGENYGWRLMEGSNCFNPATGCNDGTLTLPILQYSHAAGDCSVIGGFSYRGSASTGLLGLYLFADFCTGRIWAAAEDGAGGWTSELLQDTDLLISAFGEDEQGEIYVAHLASPAGTIYRIRDASVENTPTSDGGDGGGGGGGGGCFIGSASGAR